MHVVGRCNGWRGEKEWWEGKEEEEEGRCHDRKERDEVGGGNLHSVTRMWEREGHESCILC